MSHTSRDKPVVERISAQLRREGLRPFLDSSDLTAGEHWQRELAGALAHSRTCALFVGPHPFGPWQLEELELALVWANRRHGCRVFAVLLPGAEDPFDPQQLPPFLSTRTWVDLRGGTGSRQALQRLLNAIKGVAQGSGEPTESLGDVVPYRGLGTFEEEHAEFFFGRERDVQRLLEMLKVSRLLCVVGPSGSGKSSLVRAGLVPRLRDGALTDVEDCTVCVLRPGAHPLQALATQLAPLGAGNSMQATLNDLAADRRSLHLAVSLALGGDSPASRVLIVVDQLEEVFTRCDDESEREQFFANLLHAAFAGGGQTVVVLTLRADFYARCADYPELAQRAARSLALVGPMDDDELRQAIEEPARRVGLFLESGLVQTILDDVGEDAGALPLLEHALLEVWRRRVGDQLTLDAYVEAGRVQGALAQRAESVFSSFATPQQQIARRIMLRLTEPGEGTEDTRRRATRGELAPAEDDNDFDVVLRRLIDARLLTTGSDDTGLTVVDVSHEALIRGWPRLRGWIDADRAGLLIHRRLTDAAREWDTLGREPTALYRGAKLATANEWATEHSDHLSALERDFLTTSTTLQQHDLEAAKRRTRRLRALASGLAALTAVVAVLAAWALDQRSTAQHQTAQAASVALASSALPPLRSRPDISLLLALEAMQASPRAEARSSMVSALQATRNPRLLAIIRSHTDSVGDPAFSPSGHTLAFSDGNTIRLWDTSTHKQIGASLIGHTERVGSLAFSPVGHTLASCDDKTVRFWDTRRHKQIGALSTGRGSSLTGGTLAFSPDGDTLAADSHDGTIRLWNTRTHKQIGVPLKGHTSWVSSLAFSPVGYTLASVSIEEGAVRLWNTTTHKQIGAPLKSDAASVSFSPDGRSFASAGGDATVRLWDVRTQTQIGAPFNGHTDIVQSVAFSSDGHTLASASNDKTIRLWNTRTNKQIGAPLKGHTGRVWTVALSRDGHTLASASEDGTIRLWDARPPSRHDARLTGHTDAVNDVAFSSDGRMLASASNDKTVRLWNTRTHNQIGTPLKGHTDLVTQLALSPVGHTLASIGDDKTVRLWNTSTGKQVGVSTLSSSDADRMARLWIARTRKQFERGGGGPFLGLTDGVIGVAFSPDIRTLATFRQDGTIWLWAVRTGKQIGKPLTGHPHGVVHFGRLENVAFSPDAHRLASGNDDGTIRLWNTRTHEQIGKPLKGHTDTAPSVAFSPDGHTLASGSDDGTVRLWNTRTHEQLGRPITGDTEPVRSVAFSPDGRTLASASDTPSDKRVRLWDVDRHKQLGPSLTSNSREIHRVAFSPDGRTLTASDGRTIPLWDILWHDFRELQTEVCKLVGTGLSKTEWAQYAAGIPYHQSCP